MPIFIRRFACHMHYVLYFMFFWSSLNTTAAGIIPPFLTPLDCFLFCDIVCLNHTIHPPLEDTISTFRTR
ncbi:hypothetical protein O0I10_011413 [Lichtheimia ornata]|uniref:Uncharacterized protein n=1 Tax=Lichtheimia ornata TaxID=688661 RepID=A0AAD7UTT4_9FUNG|nr:uncharacterized protein O0I10_011413 [Lichtheimia ornata]KAJ8652951.1 hypothetical protein O0I10_011413 [Lichtheimia ornata]